MDNKEILRHIDHTLLKATATWKEIRALCDEAVAFETATVCIPPSYVSRIHEAYGDKLRVCTVIGFPLGYTTTEIKTAEAAQAIAEGAAEVDMVVNLGDVKDGSFEKVTNEIASVKKAVGDHVLKVIIETCYLTREEKIALCECVTKAGADFIKTSTGLATGGATIEDILLFKEHIGPNVRMKAAGGVRSREDLEKFLNAGCDRIGTSSAVSLLKGEAAGDY